jgi:alkyl hydroperoxide reductase subunit D
MTLDNLLAAIPDYAKDIRLNLNSMLNNHASLSDTRFYGSLLAASYASRNADVIDAVSQLTADKLSSEVQEAVRAATAIMSMTNIYYRFTDLVANEAYGKMPAGLRMNMMREHRADKLDFELFCLVVSIINGCSMCISAHEKQLIKAGINNEAIQMVAKLASVIHALSVVSEIARRD